MILETLLSVVLVLVALSCCYLAKLSNKQNRIILELIESNKALSNFAVNQKKVNKDIVAEIIKLKRSQEIESRLN